MKINEQLERLKSLGILSDVTAGIISETLQRFPQNVWFEPSNVFQFPDYTTCKDAAWHGLIAEKRRPVYDETGKYKGIKYLFFWNEDLNYTEV
jgi:hypothetical protein